MGGGDITSAMEAVSQTDAAGDAVTVDISCSPASKFSVQIKLDSTVLSFKALLARNCDIPADQQCLIYKGRILKDDQTLQSYGLEADHTVRLVRRFAPTPSPTTTNASGSISSGGSNTSQTNSRGVGLDDGGTLGPGGAGQKVSLFPGLGFGGLGGSAGLFGAGLPDFEQVHRKLTQNRDIMTELMNMPTVRNLINDPDMVGNLIMNNPQLAELIDRNPELAHLLNDPAAIHRTLEAARNPELMREILRNSDRAMSNIVSFPEGFNTLHRIYETVQEPFMNSTTLAGPTGNGGTDPFAALLGSQGGNQVRDRSTNQSSPASGTTDSPAPNTNPLPNPWSSSAGGGAQTNTTRSDHSADSRPQAPSGLGGLGLPSFEGLFGAMQDTNSLNQLMQNPIISPMMQSLLSNPSIHEPGSCS
ncbi:ubiquitin domain-containing protein DSK2b-like [Hibiscus syriacus]|uniref:ubiquitin domain-containing protein DSK2b-like n=1 Tax=Hibiscus syriacus TaxID=106335 RepID=UPI001921D219|nr:ubiquitin domain-containing protein DSK2b-like [Hibiscus syriacus]XP_039069662.1 ubiquitin domain-containing protein DSK2b-like [Hibiscus syriacus]